MKARRLTLAIILAAFPLGRTSIAQTTEQAADAVLANYSGVSIPLQRLDHEAIDFVIDGKVDEDFWIELPTYGELKITEPDTLADPGFRTDLRIFYTERGIFLAFDMEQPAETLVERYSVRDRSQMVRDSVAVSLDMSGEGRYGYWVSLSLGDNQADGTILPERQYSRDWDGAWYGATAVTDSGWSAEFFVPWSQMAMPRQQDARRIGIYVSRKVAHLSEKWAWPPLPNSQPRFMSALQPLQLEDVNPRQQWSLFPYGSATYDRIDKDSGYRAGFDVFWRPSTNAQLTGTLNPDFGTIEADNITVNLTADETFFPEKRLFFQEGQEIFSTTPRADDPVRTPFMIINTRRIGGRPNDPELPPGVSLSPREGLRLAELDGALKLTGQLGRMRYGTLAAFEDRTDFRADGQVFTQDGRDFGAVRLIYEDDAGASYRGLGLVSTLVSHADGDALVNGIDFHYLSTGGQWSVDGQLLHSSLDTAGSGKGALVDIAYTQRQGLRHSVALTALDDTFDVNDFGFQRRNDISEIFYKTTWVRSGLSKIRDFVIEPSFTYEVNGDGLRTEVKLDTDVQITLNNLHDLNLYAGYYPESFDDRNSFGNGTFKTEERYSLFAQYTADTGKPVSFFAGSSLDTELLGGHTVGAFVGGTWRPSRNISFELSTKYLDYGGWLLHQEGQDFTTFNADQWTHEINFEYFPAAKQHFQIALQWVGIRAIESEFFRLPDDSMELVPVTRPPGPADDFSLSQLNFQVRYRWQIAPLSDLFIVYTKADNRQTMLTSFGDLFNDSWSEPLGDQLVIKLRYRLGSI